MNLGRTVFSQIMEHLPEYEFQKCVARYRGDSHLRGFSCLDQYLAMSFAQLTYRESLRDIEACLRSVASKLYHMGLRGKVSRTTLADANESHDWRIFADFAQVLVAIARPLYAGDPIGVDLDASLYALDSTTIDLCLALFPWAGFRKHKGAVKMHTLLDLHGNIPTFISITEGKCMTSTSSTKFYQRPGRSTSWTAATWISSASTSSRSARLSSSCAPNLTSCFSAATRIPWTGPPEFDPITPSS